MNDHLVSVVIPCYNCETTINETIQSVLSQTYKNIEIICVNDGSTDNTLVKLQEIGANNNRITVINQENKGQSKTRNTGAIAAKGYYLFFLDADDLIAPTFFEKAVNIIENNQDVQIVYARSEFFGARTGEWKLADFEIKSFLRDNCIPIAALIRKEEFIKADGFDESLTFFEDWELWLKIIINGGKVYRIPETLFFYRKHPEKTSLTNKAWKEKTIISKNKLAIYNKHYDFYHNNLGSFDELLTDFKYKEKYYNVWYKKLFYKLKKKK